MILSCPACSTRFVLDPARIGAAGRRVRCARCRHVWFQEPPADTPVDTPADTPMVPPVPTPGNGIGDRSAAMAEPAAGGRDQGGAASGVAGVYGLARRFGPPRINLPALRSAPVRRAALGWGLLVLLVVGLVGTVYAGREQIVQWWPPAYRLYDVLGIQVAGLDAADGTAFEVRGISTRRDDGADGSRLIVTGQVVNLSDEVRPPPAVQVTLLGEDDDPLQRWSFQPAAERLAPGEAAGFETVVTDPDPAASYLSIRVLDAATAAANP